MSIDKYIKQSKIGKVVDPGLGDAPMFGSVKEVTSPVPIEVPETPIGNLVQDLIVEAQNVQTEIQETITLIVETNKQDPTFASYATMVKENHFNPIVLLQNPNARPIEVHPYNLIKKAEAEVYQTLSDPRAPFVQDLYHLLAEAGLTEYSLKRVWDSNIQDSPPLLQYALKREQQSLTNIKYSQNRIKSNVAQSIGYGFVNAIAEHVMSQLASQDFTNQLKVIEQVKTLLRKIKLILEIGSIVNGSFWDKFSTNIKDIYGDFLLLTANKITKEQSYNLYHIIEKKVTDGINHNLESFIQGLDRIFPPEFEITSIPEVQEFLSQINTTVRHNLETIEEDLVSKEGIQLKLEENRQLLVLNSQKNTKTKQYIHVIDEAIHYLDILRSEFYNLDGLLSTEKEKLVYSLLNKADNYIRTIKVR